METPQANAGPTAGEKDCSIIKKSARRTRLTHMALFKVRVALAALCDDRTLTELCKEFELHPNQITNWRLQLIVRAAGDWGG